jgi:ABC-type Mn2+/Zn2+ transport system ATPase subunit
MFLQYSKRHIPTDVPARSALTITDLTVGYYDSLEPAVCNISLDIPAGIRAALVGANGSGKSTLLKAIAGLLKPLAGTILIYGQPVGTCHQRVAYLPQRSEVDWRFPVTVQRLVLAGRYVHLGWLKRPNRKDNARVNDVLDQLGLADLADRQISQLSGGQQQRALLARALVQEADLLLLDEPLSAVDASSRQIIADVLNRLRQQGKTALVATHHLDRLEEEYDQIYDFESGTTIPAKSAMFSLEAA